MNRQLSQFKYIMPIDSMDLYGYYCLRILIDRNTGEQISGYVMPKGVRE